MDHTSNPLFGHNKLPDFERITAAHVEPAIDQLTRSVIERLEEIESAHTASWEGLVQPLEDMFEPLTYAWGIVGHLMGTRNSPELREAHKNAQPKVVETELRVSQSRPVFESLIQLREGPGWDGLDEAQQRIVESRIRDAKLAGVGLEGDYLERFKQIETRLAELRTTFMNNILDSTKEFSLTLTDPAEVKGLPATVLASAAQAAKSAGEKDPDGADPTPEDGPWRITLDLPMYTAFSLHGERRDIREKLHRAYVTRASEGATNNHPVMDEILKLRKEKAQLLGFGTYAEVSLESKMAPSVDAVDDLLAELRGGALPRSHSEIEELQDLARTSLGDEGFQISPWDVGYWSERSREAKFNYTEEELRPYFSLPRVLDGLFGVVRTIFGVTVKPADGEAKVWHKDVRFFNVFDADDNKIASVFIDPYSRPEDKRPGAWMDFAYGRKRLPDGSVRLPVAYLICNQTPPVGDDPSLMTFSEVKTLFHEFGHGLQHMLTTVDYAGAAGIENVEWDAVELPSTFMENWCYHRQTLLGLAKHYQTGETLPEETFEKLKGSRTHVTGTLVARQVSLSAVDLELHHRYEPGGPVSVFDVQRQVAKDNVVLEPIPEDRFLCGFSHIFSGGYAAGYYSYSWAAVLAADAFSAFEEEGLDSEESLRKTGTRFKETVLSLGGSRHPMEVFKQFRGREPSTEPLMRQLGLK